MDLGDVIEHHPETKPFWHALGEGRMLIRHCRACDRPHWYPRAYCPHCGSGETEWREASGRGRIYSYSISRTVPEPYAIAYVTLEEGPTMMTRIAQSSLDDLAVGKAVTLVVGQAPDGTPLPLFKLI